MRNVFLKNLLREAHANPAIILLTGDLGFKALEDFQQRLPRQFYNVGAAEANMIGVAAGLALSGKKVFVYSIAPFITFRVYEHLRNDICHHQLDVTLIATGGGFSYGTQGRSHNLMEDLAAMRVLPHMKILVPADQHEAEAASNIVLSTRGPTYLRLGKNLAEIHAATPTAALGQGIVVQSGSDLTVVGIGNIMNVVRDVGSILQRQGLSVRIISLLTLKPLDEALIKQAAQETHAVFTVEEHSFHGGLGGAVAEVLMESERNGHITFRRFALPEESYQRIGSQEYLREVYHLSADHISRSIRDCLRRADAAGGRSSAAPPR